VYVGAGAVSGTLLIILNISSASTWHDAGEVVASEPIAGFHLEALSRTWQNTAVQLQMLIDNEHQAWKQAWCQHAAWLKHLHCHWCALVPVRVKLDQRLLLRPAAYSMMGPEHTTENIQQKDAAA
jgi:hypothetical protein